MNTRRQFLQCLASAWALPLAAKPGDEFRGVFPIMQTPYLESGGVDFDTLAAETVFLDKTGVHGMVWPQLASEYARLEFDERITGAETIVKTSKGLSPKVVIGVQAGDTETAVKYTKHADKLRPDAIIALPPRKGDQREFKLDEIKTYYKAVGGSTDLPMFIQAIGNMSVEFILDLMKDVPNLRFVKDEAGDSLDRLDAFAKVEGSPEIFTGGHGRMLIDELARGVSGNMPAASWVDLYVNTWELWEEGRRGEALDMFSKVTLFTTQTQSSYGLAMLNYVLHLRGVFPNWKVRNPNQQPLDAKDREALERTYEFVKPYFRV